MVKTLQIDGKTIEINTSNGWLYVYRNQFGRDILPDLMPIVEGILSGIAGLLEESDGELSGKTFAAAINNDALVDTFIRLAGMEVLTVFNIFWAMAKNQDAQIKEPQQYFNQFEKFPADDILPKMFKAVVESSVSSKNAKRLLKSLKRVRQSASMSSPSQGSKED